MRLCRMAAGEQEGPGRDGACAADERAGAHCGAECNAGDAGGRKAPHRGDSQLRVSFLLSLTNKANKSALLVMCTCRNTGCWPFDI